MTSYSDSDSLVMKFEIYKPSKKEYEFLTKINPIIKLNFLENTAIYTSTKEEYDEIRNVFQARGWVWKSFKLAMEQDLFNAAGNQTCLYLEKIFIKKEANSDEEFLEQVIFTNNERYPIDKREAKYRTHTIDFNKFKKMSPQEFYKEQNITPGIIKELRNLYAPREKTPED